MNPTKGKTTQRTCSISWPVGVGWGGPLGSSGIRLVQQSWSAAGFLLPRWVVVFHPKSHWLVALLLHVRPLHTYAHSMTIGAVIMR